MTSTFNMIATLVTRAFLPMAAGRQPTLPPPPGTVLSEGEREAAGFSGPGVSCSYPMADGTTLLINFGAEAASLVHPTVDANAVIHEVERAIGLAAMDHSGQTVPDPSDPARRLRILTVRLSEDRYAQVTFIAPALDQPSQAGVTVRVAGLRAIGLRGGEAA